MKKTEGGETTLYINKYYEKNLTTGSMPTDKLFTGQRLDQTGLYFYNARYYDATIERFISGEPFRLKARTFEKTFALVY